jgi:hypothetical protein
MKQRFDKGRGLSLLTRSSDGQLLFLANMISKMKHDTPLGSRIAEVHNGSSLFTGDAGQGESNIRRWIIENDWLEPPEKITDVKGNTGQTKTIQMWPGKKCSSWFSVWP